MNEGDRYRSLIIEIMRLRAVIFVACLAFTPRTTAFSPSTRTNGNGSNVICYYTDGDTPPPSIDIPRKSRHKPRRALPHIQTSSSDEAASKAGYIIRRGVADERTPLRHKDKNNSRQERRPLRTIRRAVHRSEGESSQTSNKKLERNQSQQEVQGAGKQTRASKDERVTFKATREASHSISKFASGFIPTKDATLTDYMTQPVEDYSLLSFHDEEGPSSSNDQKETTSRRWFVRRLTHEEAIKYIVDPSCNAVKEFNLFRLAVPLQPLIGWDLTPVIDLEVIPPEIPHEESSSFDHQDNDLSSQISEEESRNDSDSSKWRPLKGIRSRVDGSRDEKNHPTVKIRSMSVSLLSTKEEIRQLMKSPGGRQTITAKDKEMQTEAIGMVGKVEEWLKPHITFEAELAWQDENVTSKASVVSVKSSAVTSLTIPRIQNDIIRATVPSAFLVRRLGATLTSKALEICLPRFLRQLERDYYRWSGIEE